MAFQYVPVSPDLRKTMTEIFTEDFMKEETNFDSFEAFQFSSAVFVNWKSDIMVYDEEVLNTFVKESTRFSSWDEMVKAAADRRFGQGSSPAEKGES